MSLHHAKDEAISYLEANHRTRAGRRAKLRDDLRQSENPLERLAVGMAEHGHTVASIMTRCGVPEMVARTLITGEAP